MPVLIEVVFNTRECVISDYNKAGPRRGTFLPHSSSGAMATLWASLQSFQDSCLGSAQSPAQETLGPVAALPRFTPHAEKYLRVHDASLASGAQPRCLLQS